MRFSSNFNPLLEAKRKKESYFSNEAGGNSGSRVAFILQESGLRLSNAKWNTSPLFTRVLQTQGVETKHMSNNCKSTSQGAPNYRFDD